MAPANAAPVRLAVWGNEMQTHPRTNWWLPPPAARLLRITPLRPDIEARAIGR